MQFTELGKIGLTEGEIKVYQALLDKGECTKTSLARASAVSPSKIYEVTDRLIRKGVVSSVKKKGVLHFKAANPECLSDFIRNKEEELNKEKQVVKNLLPSLLAKFHEVEGEIDVNVFYGWDGAKTAFITLENSMKRNDVSFVFGASAGVEPKMGDVFWSQHQARVERRGYKVKIIFNEDMRKRKQRHSYYDNSPLHEIRYLHQKTLNELYVYNKYVLFFISLKKPISILIKNKETVDAFRKFFESLWNQATP